MKELTRGEKQEVLRGLRDHAAKMHERQQEAVIISVKKGYQDRATDAENAYHKFKAEWGG